MTVKADEIVALIDMFAASGWNELHVETAGLQLFLSTDPTARLVTGNFAQVPAALVAARPAVETEPAAQPPADAAPNQVPPHWKPVKAPNLGTFYRSPKPGAAPYVEVGDAVTSATEICLIEVMKLFTALRAGMDGIVRRICAEDGDLIEGEQILFYIEPP